MLMWLTIAAIAIVGVIFFFGLKQSQKIAAEVTEQMKKDEEEALIRTEKLAEKERLRAAGLLKPEDDTPFEPYRGGYEKLDRYKIIPHPVDDEFFQVFDNRPLIMTDKWKDEATRFPMVYSCVVQAHSDFYEKQKDDFKGAMVLITPINPERYYDIVWLQNLSGKITDIRDSVNVPEDAKKMVNYLRDHQSFFCTEVPPSLTDGEKVFIWVCEAYASELPNSVIPDHAILPIFIYDEPKENHIYFQLAKAKGYQ